MLEKVCKKEKMVLEGVNFYETVDDSHFFILDFRTKVLLRVTLKNFEKKRDDLMYQPFQNAVHSIYFKKVEYKILVIRRKMKFAPQSLFGNFMKSMSGIKHSLEFFTATCSKTKQMFTEQGYLWFLDLVNMILNIREGYLTPTKIVSVVISIYTMYKRAAGIFSPQSIEEITFDAASVIFSVIGLPASLVKIIREYSMMTGRRLFSSTTILNVILSIYQLFKYFLKWLTTFMNDSEQNVYLASYADYILDMIFGSISSYSKIKMVTELNLQYSATPEVILRPDFRDKVTKVYEEANNDALFKDYVANNDNKNFKAIWESFTLNLVKYVKTFTISSKKEPICLVFEGKPGSGKSVLMNNFVEVLKQMNKSVYIHSIPPTDAGKDFYDDYENQDVFVMDDIGQQGKSQWRTIINFVSPVKYPLECANAAKKNTKFFNSEYILCTTNGFMELHGFTNKDCVSEPQALFRRCHVIKVEKAQGEDFTQNIKYYKYDHLSPNPGWENKFLYHNSKIPLVSSINSADRITSLNYLRQLLVNLEKTENENRTTVKIKDDEMQQILVDQDFAPQTLTDMATFLSNLYYEWPSNARNVFVEWFEYILKPVKVVMESMTYYIKNLLFGVSYDEEITRIITARSPKDVLGKYNERVKNYRKLASKYHPDKYLNEIVFEDHKITRDESTLLFTIINLANQHYDDPDNFYHQVENIYSDPRSQFYFDAIKHNLGAKHHDYVVNNFAYLKLIISGIPHMWSNMDFATKVSVAYLGIYAAAIVGCLFTAWCGESPTPKYDMRDLWTKHQQQHSFMPQTHVDTTTRKHVKFAVVKDGVNTEHYTHIIVSGDRFLVNSHIGIPRGIITVYNSYEHFQNKHAEVENIEFFTISDYASCDIRVCKFKNFHPFYPKATPLFKSREVTPVIQMHSSLGRLDLLFHKNVFTNEIAVEYTGYDNVTYKHPENTGLLTPIEGSGLCGSFILNSHGHIIAIHAAGDGKQGFCVIPSANIADMIRQDMFACHPLDVNIDTTPKENFSGVRLVYNSGDIEKPFVSGKTKNVPSIFHVNNNEKMRNLVEVIKTLDEPLVVPTQIDERGPPIIPNPSKTLKDLSKKSFANQGAVTFEELKFIKDCIRELMPKEKYYDLTVDECAFGAEDIAPLNKDTSNGYGHPNKNEYFDFENKTLTPKFIKECQEFEQRVREDKLIYKDFLTKEVFKVDELRNQDKRDKPRTIRVMPITNIWYTKRIFGNLARYLKKHRAENGIGYGFNPYIDMERVYKKLRTMDLTGDLDAAKWDGSLVALIMEAILEVMLEQYDGEFKYMESYLAKSIIRTLVIISDELYATTHGLPSGTWLTLLLNSLYNRALDALVLYRKHPQPTVALFRDIYSEVTGDDKVFGIPKHLSQYVNLLTYKEVFESLGMKCTNGDKSEITKPSQSLERMTYLKRHFRFHPVLEKWVGPLSINTILSIPQWISTDTNYEEAMAGKMRASQVEAYLHSPALFRSLTNIYGEKLGYTTELFDEARVVSILTSPDGYAKVLEMLNKFDYTF